MLLHQRNQTDVAARTQQPSASYLGKLVAMYVKMVIASSTAPNQSHCCWDWPLARSFPLRSSPILAQRTRALAPSEVCHCQSGSRSLFAGARYFPHCTRSPNGIFGGEGHDRLERRGREKEPIDFPAINEETEYPERLARNLLIEFVGGEPAAQLRDQFV